MSHISPSDENIFGGPWSIQKLDCVENYIRAYLSVMKNQFHFDLWYIDAFCGNGIQRFRDVESNQSLFGEYEDDVDLFTQGSSLRAVMLSEKNGRCGKRTFDHFVFIEYDQKKLDELSCRISSACPTQFPKCEFICGDVNEELPHLLSRINWRRGGRAVCFVDPFATQMVWRTIEAFQWTLADVWLLVPIESYCRMLPRDRLPDSGLSRKLFEVFGDFEWRSIYHEVNTGQMTLFDETHGVIARDRGCEEILAYLGARLETVFPTVLEPAILKRYDGAPKFALYALIANPSSSAIKIASDIANDLIRKIS